MRVSEIRLRDILVTCAGETADIAADLIETRATLQSLQRTVCADSDTIDSLRAEVMQLTAERGDLCAEVLRLRGDRDKLLAIIDRHEKLGDKYTQVLNESTQWMREQLALATRPAPHPFDVEAT